MEDHNSYPGGFNIRMQQKERAGSFWTPLLLTLLTVGSMGFCIQNALYPDITYIMLILSVLLTGCLVAWISRNEKRLFAGLGIFLILAAVVLAAGYSDWKAGALDFLNRGLLRYNYVTGLAYDYFNTDFCNNINQAAALFWCFFVVCLTVYLGLMIVLKHPLLLLCCWLPVIGGCIFLQLPVGSLVIACAVVSVVGTFAYSQMKSNDDHVYAVAILMVSAVIGVISVLYFQSGSFHPSHTMAVWKQDTVAVSEKMRYGKQDTPQGQVGKKVGSSDDVRFQVGMSAPKKLYLKGFTGSVWEQGRWEVLPGTSYSQKYEGMIKGYTKRGFHPLAQMHHYIEMAEQVAGAGIEHETVDITVKNVSAFRKYQYIPYGISFDSMMKLGTSNQDINMPGTVSKKEADNTYQAKVNVLAQDAMLAYTRESWLNAPTDVSEETGEYRIAEADYREFVHAFYLELSDEQRREAEEALTVNDRSNMVPMTNQIREYLMEEGLKAGDWNTTDYTSRAVLLYRSLDVPARYVEGYIADAEKKAAAPDGLYHVDVLAKHAHAWVELYKDGVGWIPVDVTPGFYHHLSGTNQNLQQSAAANSEQTKEEESEEEEKPEKGDTVGFGWLLWLLLALVILCILACVTIYVRSRLIQKRIQDRLAAEDIWIRLEQSAAILDSIYHYKRWEEKQLDGQIRRILNAYRFSTHPEKLVLPEDVAQVQEYMQKLQQNVYQEAGKWEQLKLKYLEVII